MKRVKRRARSEDPGEPPHRPDEPTEEYEVGTGDEPTVRDKKREMEWRHSTGVNDREASPSDERGVRDDEGSGEPENDDRRHAAEEASSSESDEVDVEEMTTEDEEELWRRAERDGFPRE